MELNREQIIKALEYCSSGGQCYKCSENDKNPFLSKEGCMAVQMRNALALIRELTKENERLIKYLDEHFPKCIYQYDGDVQEYCVLAPCGQFKTVAEFQRQIEADAVRDFAERLKYTLCINNEENTEFFDYEYTLETIDQIAKEMLEGKT